MIKPYTVEFEIAGPAAMFARPDTGSTPISYPVPTWSACKAMFESVARGVLHEKREPGQPVEPGAFFCPTEVEIWKPIRFEKYVTNYRGPLRKTDEVAKDNSYQLAATILVDVCYRIRGNCVDVPNASGNNRNASHALQEMFLRRLRRGQSKYAPCLGWKEFLPTYFGLPREHLSQQSESPSLQANIHLSIPAFLLSNWDAPINGRYAPVFRHLRIESGKATFPPLEVQDGRMIFTGGVDAK